MSKQPQQVPTARTHHPRGSISQTTSSSSWCDFSKNKPKEHKAWRGLYARLDCWRPDQPDVATYTIEVLSLNETDDSPMVNFPNPTYCMFCLGRIRHSQRLCEAFGLPLKVTPEVRDGTA